MLHLGKNFLIFATTQSLISFDKSIQAKYMKILSKQTLFCYSSMDYSITSSLYKTIKTLSQFNVSKRRVIQNPTLFMTIEQHIT